MAETQLFCGLTAPHVCEELTDVNSGDSSVNFLCTLFLSVASLCVCVSASSCEACVSPTEQQSHPGGSARGFFSPTWCEQTCTRMRMEYKAGSWLHQVSQEQMEREVSPLREAPRWGCPGLHQGKISSLRTILEISATKATGRQWSWYGAGLWAVGCPWQECVHSHC